jgi:FkbM family methyltransferase
MLIDYDSIVKKYNINLTGVIHIGGHLGEEIPLYKQQTDNIHIFEPLIECYNQIDPTVKKYNVALGSQKQTLSFFVSNNFASSSFLKPKTHLIEHAHVTFDETPRLFEVNTLDSYCINDCNFLNIDVQGFEIEVLKGAIHTLKSIEYILIEVNIEELYEKCAKLADLDNFLCDFERVETEMTHHGWGDALYIKNKI